ncbi:Gfo/Idh/MocA family oxidoreductase [Candidatus Poribacteria bacterium]|nr:Gfo/Idh/MocA family oxidoreductase [Candidatus Poribacteria bacterium]
MPTHRIYIIGVGAIAGSHIQAIERLPGNENMEVHVSDINPEALARTREQYPRIQVYDDTATMLSSPAQADDIVIVSTPPVSHCALTLQGLESGRHVLCEKPLAMNQGEALAMLQKVREMDRLLGCCSVRFIGHRATETLKRWLDEGKLGEVYNVNWHVRGQGSREGMVVGSAKWRMDRRKSGGGVVMDWGAYDFTTLSDVLKPLKVEVLHAWMAPPVVNAQLSEGAVLDVEFHAGAAMLYHREHGSAVPVSFERGHPAYGTQLELFEFQGTKGTAVLNWLQGGLKRYFDSGGKVVSEEVPCEPGANEPQMLQRPLCYFYDAVNGCPSPAVLNEQAVFNFDCLRAVYTCAETGCPQTVIIQGD